MNFRTTQCSYIGWLNAFFWESYKLLNLSKVNIRFKVFLSCSLIRLKLTAELKINFFGKLNTLITFRLGNHYQEWRLQWNNLLFPSNLTEPHMINKRALAKPLHSISREQREYITLIHQPWSDSIRTRGSRIYDSL